MNLIKKRLRIFRGYPPGLKVITIIIFTTILVMPFLDELSINYNISTFLFCLFTVAFCYSVILMNPRYAKLYRCSLKKERYNMILGIVLLFLSCLLLFSSMVFFVVQTKKELHIDECLPPKTQVGTTCCVLSNSTNAFCADEVDAFSEKFDFAFKNSIKTENTTLQNKKETFSFQPEDGYYMLFDVEMLERNTDFYLIKPIDNETSACEIKVSERDVGLTFKSETKIIEEMIEGMKKQTYNGEKEEIITDNNTSGYLLVLTSDSKPTRETALFFNNKKLVMFISAIEDNKYSKECNEMFEKTIKTFQWESE